MGPIFLLRRLLVLRVAVRRQICGAVSIHLGQTVYRTDRTAITGAFVPSSTCFHRRGGISHRRPWSWPAGTRRRHSAYFEARTPRWRWKAPRPWTSSFFEMLKRERRAFLNDPSSNCRALTLNNNVEGRCAGFCTVSRRALRFRAALDHGGASAAPSGIFLLTVFLRQRCLQEFHLIHSGLSGPPFERTARRVFLLAALGRGSPRGPVVSISPTVKQPAAVAVHRLPSFN